MNPRLTISTSDAIEEHHLPVVFFCGGSAFYFFSEADSSAFTRLEIFV